MEEMSVKLLRSRCCTCLSRNRNLFQLCRIVSGINNLYSLLSYDSEAYREGFYMDSANLFVCWECRALLQRFRLFRQQACLAQKTLSSIVERQDVKSALTLSKLSIRTITTFNLIITKDINREELSDNFIDCGPNDLEVDVKSELEDDLPLSELNNDNYSDNSDTCLKELKNAKEVRNSNLCQQDIKSASDLTILKTERKKSKCMKSTGKLKKNKSKDEKYFTSAELSEEDMLESRKHRMLAASFADASYKCDSCIEGFRLKIDYQNHVSTVHTELANHSACPICRVYVPSETLEEHRAQHYWRHGCQLCDHVTYSTQDILAHLKKRHSVKNVKETVRRIKGCRKTPLVKNPGSKPRRNAAMMDRRTPYGYRCTDCDKYFETKSQRWKHVQRAHRAGYTCDACPRTFAFKNNLTRHQLMHSAPPPREQCPVCHKQIRVDLMRTHSRIHSNRQTYSCEECDKRFVSLASYEHHLKYSLAHCTQDLLKHKCSMCSKGYRSRGELRDHVNYQHKGTTLHKCPVCGKALATRRCITRHVRRAHEGVKESARDKICQLCGKAFRDKKGLREHERIHTGERPLSCSLCGATFRQSASLYTHKRRVHRIIPDKKTVEHTTES